MKAHIICFSAISLIFGIFFAAIINRVIVIQMALTTSAFRSKNEDQRETHTQKTITFWYPTKKDFTLRAEGQAIIWPAEKEQQLFIVLNHWFKLLLEEGIIPQEIRVETVAETPTHHFIVSCSKPWWHPHQSTAHKQALLDAFTKTLVHAGIEHCDISLLIRQIPASDPHVDHHKIRLQKNQQSLPEPLAHRKLILPQALHPHLVVYAPGNNRHPGRPIGNEFEWGMTRALSEQLRHYITEHVAPNVPIAITLHREPADIANSAEQATHINIYRPSLYLVLHAHQSNTEHPTAAICYYEHAPGDHLPYRTQADDLIPVEDIHRLYLSTSRLISARISEILQKNGVTIEFLGGLACSRLAGVAAPACLIDFGLNKPQQIAEIAPILGKAITALVLESNQHV